MANDSRDARTESNPVVLAWGLPAEAEGFFGDATLWLTGGVVSLVAWTLVALVLTSA
ncbi:hypothetical protein H8N03_10720 [Ramlibacter sp. USB13]|uniref:Uncharacterized protein n=1 Tax=Ramlibacter cellulosilyticus TaxID=2764187 RepID=A0A923SBQ4_9BURK|nr:hypothetical protein [Ramlibacter cellulosilyticus]MBC5783418.1 hypothetical protein [Ramlibacter cellulosilyticus]